MSGKLKNIDDIKLMLPDYILGNLSGEDSRAVENAIGNSEELKILADEIGNAFEIMKTAKHGEPDPAYWMNLLPRIHERIDETADQRFSWGKLVHYWKVALPAAAVLLIAILYFFVFNNSDETIIAKKENKETVIDSVKYSQSNENEKVKDEKPEDEKKKDKLKKERGEKIRIKTYNKQNYDLKADMKKENVLQNEVADNDNIAEYEEVSVISGGAGGIDDEMDRELNMLSNKEKELLLEELIESNL